MNNDKVAELRGIAQIAFAQDALRGIVLLNGGALIALLALFGQVWSKDASEASLVMATLKPGLLLFLCGTLSGIAAQGMAYLAQQSFVEGRRALGRNLHHVVVLLSLSGMYFFAHGSFRSISSFVG